MPRLFGRKPPPTTGIEPDQIQLTLTVETLDPVHGHLSWTGVEKCPRTIEALEAAHTRLFDRSMKENTDDC